MADKIDLERMSVAELEKIRNEVLRNLALRQIASSDPTPVGPHDRHRSSHEKNSIEMIEFGGEFVQPRQVAPRKRTASRKRTE